MVYLNSESFGTEVKNRYARVRRASKVLLREVNNTMLVHLYMFSIYAEFMCEAQRKPFEQVK